MLLCALCCFVMYPICCSLRARCVLIRCCLLCLCICTCCMLYLRCCALRACYVSVLCFVIICYVLSCADAPCRAAVRFSFLYAAVLCLRCHLGWLAICHALMHSAVGCACAAAAVRLPTCFDLQNSVCAVPALL